METKRYIEAKAKVIYYTKWVIAQCDPSIVDYYVWWYLRKKHIKLMRSKHGSHISVVRGEEEGIEKGNWERDVETLPEITFYYSHEDLVEGNNYVWLNVHGDDLVKIRTDLGLADTPPFGWHLTIGRMQ